jgi:hypothetical protein
MIHIDCTPMELATNSIIPARAPWIGRRFPAGKLRAESFECNDSWRKPRGCQWGKMLIVSHNEFGMRRDRTVHKLVIVGISGDDVKLEG